MFLTSPLIEQAITLKIQPSRQCIMRERPEYAMGSAERKEQVGKSAEEWHFALRERLR
jgi:hypothetical protein